MYAFYSWLLWPVLLRSALRQLTERRDWAKTEREVLEPARRARIGAAVETLPANADPAPRRPVHR